MAAFCRSLAAFFCLSFQIGSPLDLWKPSFNRSRCCCLSEPQLNVSDNSAEMGKTPDRRRKGSFQNGELGTWEIRVVLEHACVISFLSFVLVMGGVFVCFCFVFVACYSWFPFCISWQCVLCFLVLFWSFLVMCLFNSWFWLLFFFSGSCMSDGVWLFFFSIVFVMRFSFKICFLMLLRSLLYLFLSLPLGVCFAFRIFFVVLTYFFVLLVICCVNHES